MTTTKQEAYTDINNPSDLETYECPCGDARCHPNVCITEEESAPVQMWSPCLACDVATCEAKAKAYLEGMRMTSCSISEAGARVSAKAINTNQHVKLTWKDLLIRW